MRLTTEKFVERAVGVHGRKYDYGSSVYGKNNTDKITITCRTHGSFLQTPHDHLSGNGCPKCARDALPQHQPKTRKAFLEDAILVHGNQYDYSQVVYINAFVKVKILCPKHGEFMQSPHEHLKGQKCRSCGYEKRRLNNGFKWKSFIFPDGRTEKLQGYEPLTVRYLISSSIDPSEIRIDHAEKPVIPYEWSGSVHRYHPDCFLNKSNVLVETKSTYTWEFQEEQNKAKIKGVLRAGYRMRVIVWNRKKKLHSDVIYDNI